MTTLIPEEDGTIAATAATRKRKPNTKATVASRRANVAPAKAKSARKATPAKKAHFNIALGPSVGMLSASWIRGQRSPGGKEENTGNASAFSDKLTIGTVEVSSMDPVKLASPSNGPTLAEI